MSEALLNEVVRLRMALRSCQHRDRTKLRQLAVCRKEIERLERGYCAMTHQGKFSDFVSEESLETIRENECFPDLPSLSTKRFRRLFNEIERLQEEIEGWKRWDAKEDAAP